LLEVYTLISKKSRKMRTKNWDEKNLLSKRYLEVSFGEEILLG
jgi:hypothetical protein